MNCFLYLLVFITMNIFALYAKNATSKNNTLLLAQSGKNRTSLQIRRLEAAARKIQNLLHGPTLMRAFRRNGRVVYLPQYYFNDQDEVPSEELGPDRGPEYDPSLGHELYWVDGLWVLSTVTTKSWDKGRKEFIKLNDCSGSRCGSMYKLFGPVCGRNRYYQYKNFENYCTMKAEDCTGELGSLYNNKTSLECDRDVRDQIRSTSDQGEYTQTESELIKMAQYRSKFHYRYNPNHGYEPYWIDGEWILDDPAVVLKETGQGTTTEKPVMVCGQNCEVMFRSIKEVCVHRSEENKMENKCWRPKYFWFCHGKPGEKFHRPFETLPSYCHLLAVNCEIHFTHANFLILAHIGKCKTIDDWFKPMFDNNNVLHRMSKYPFLDQNTRTLSPAGTTVNLMKNMGR